MKTCPICSAKAFDDAVTCFGCLYRFDSEPIADEEGPTPQPPAAPSAAPATADRLPAFQITLTPPAAHPGSPNTWTCSVELVPA